MTQMTDVCRVKSCMFRHYHLGGHISTRRQWRRSKRCSEPSERSCLCFFLEYVARNAPNNKKRAQLWHISGALCMRTAQSQQCSVFTRWLQEPAVTLLSLPITVIHHRCHILSVNIVLRHRSPFLFGWTDTSGRCLKWTWWWWWY